VIVRRLTPVLRIAGAALLAALLVTGCASARATSSIAIASAYVPQPTTPGTTVAYLEIRNNGPADKLALGAGQRGRHGAVAGSGGTACGTMTMRTVRTSPSRPTR
jgi:hypothetical protein